MWQPQKVNNVMKELKKKFILSVNSKKYKEDGWTEMFGPIF